MGTNTSKIWDILYVTSEDLDPPGFNDKRKYHPPSKPVKIDYSSFGPKKYFKEDATDEEIDRHL